MHRFTPRLTGSVATAACAAAAWIALSASADSQPLAISVDIPIGPYQIIATDEGQQISIDGFGRLAVPGTPVLPSRIFAIAVPPGAEIANIACETGPGVVLPGLYDIAPAVLPRVIGVEDPAVYAAEKARYDQAYAVVYGSDDAYPSAVAELVQTSGYRKYELVDVRVTPFAYRPQSRQLTFYDHVTIHVNYTLPDARVDAMIDDLDAAEQTAQELIINYEEAQAWYPRGASAGKGLHDFVIITVEDLVSVVDPLVEWEQTKGRNVEVVTLNWIKSAYPGYDNAERIRNFLRDKYPSSEWGIEMVLIVGDYDTIPMRRTAQDMGYGQPETDFYYGELSLPDDQSWDADGDHQWGEDSDPIDYYAEVAVGRMPWTDEATVAHICQKSIAYEQTNDPSFKKNMLLLGAFFWSDTDNAVLMETKIDQPWMSDWTFTRMYEQGHSSYASDYDLNWSNVKKYWPADTYAFVNWAGHGSPTSVHVMYSKGSAFADTGTCPYLNDDYPAIIFADACSNSDTDHLNLGQSMLKQGGVGFLGATKVAFGCPGWSKPYSGSSQTMDYLFTTCVTSGAYSQGAAHAWCLAEMFQKGMWNYTRYETFEWGALWGNPDLGMAVPPAIKILLVDELPEYIDPGVATPITIEIRDGIDTYLPGSGKLHYRADGGSFDEYELTDLGDGFFEAVLPPAGCDDSPEYYFSAQSAGGTVVTSPYGAPDELYSAIIGELIVYFDDDFETDQGWEVEDSYDLTAGTWERGIPVGGGDRGDPATDFDGSGQCYVTENKDGDYDIDNGLTWLISPTFDLSEGDAEIQYALWYTNDYGADPDNDYFITYVSNDDGANWVEAEKIGPESSAGWTVHSFMVGDFVTPNDQVRVRFEASDLWDGSVVEAGIDAVKIVRLHCEETCPEDITGDGVVDVLDLLAVLAAWGSSGGGLPEDVTGDGVVDVLDLLAVLGAWGPC